MTGVLASAAAESPVVNVEIVLVALAVAAGVAVAAAVPVVIATRRRRPHRELLAAAAVVWGLATAAVVVWSVNRDWSAAAERERQVLSGDVDPRDLPPAAGTPAGVWVALGVAYVGVVGWAAAGRGGAV